jgi:tetratricopeptide (TPR) repeat protein
MIVVLALALAVAAVPANAQAVEKLTRDGKADDAVEQGRAGVAAHPDDVDMRLALARALAAKGRHVNRLVNMKLTQDDLDRGQVAVPGAALGTGPSRVEYDNGLFEEALVHLGFAIDRAPAREDLRVFQCFLLTDGDRVDRARAAIVAALDTLPKSPRLSKTMAAYGAERAKRGDSAGAALLLAPVAKAFPDDPSVLVDYGNVLTRLGRRPEAFAALDRAVTIAPKEPRYARTRAMSAMLLRDYRRAQTGFDAAFRLSREISDEFASYVAAYGIDPKAGGQMMRELGTPTGASDAAVEDLANAFSRAGKAGAGSTEAMALARQLVGSEQYLFVIPVLDRALQADKANTEVKTMLRSAYQKLGCPTLAP